MAVKAGYSDGLLAAGAADWRWSSYRFYEHGDRSVLAMDWDGRWPIEW